MRNASQCISRIDKTAGTVGRRADEHANKSQRGATV